MGVSEEVLVEADGGVLDVEAVATAGHETPVGVPLGAGSLEPLRTTSGGIAAVPVRAGIQSQRVALIVESV